MGRGTLRIVYFLSAGAGLIDFGSTSGVAGKTVVPHTTTGAPGVMCDSRNLSCAAFLIFRIEGNSSFDCCGGVNAPPDFGTRLPCAAALEVAQSTAATAATATRVKLRIRPPHTTYASGLLDAC